MQESLAKLARLGISNLYEAILFVPKSYTNTFLIKHFSPNQNGALNIKITGKTKTPKMLKISAIALDFNENLIINIFHPKPFHNVLFGIDKEMYILGELVNFNGIMQINQPKIITQINKIIMNFPTTKMKSQPLNEIFSEIISVENLASLGLVQKYIDAIYTIFHPEKNIEYLSDFKRNGGLFGVYLEAIKFVEIFYYMQSLRKKKHEFPATNRLNNEDSLKIFINNLPFNLTKGQSDCIEFLRKKLASQNATRCVVMGDVGCGKTIVILAAVSLAYPKKSVLLAPTTILAKQLYDEAKKFLSKNIRISLMIKDEKLEDCDFLIGTHSLLYRDLCDFDLFMTDEQHRFGTNQRLRLEKMLEIDGKKPHNIQFSATPIPRTMAMIESNFIDFCFIKDLPYPKNITTKIITKSEFGVLFNHIKREVSQKKQVAIIYPLVEQSEAIAYQSIKEGLPFWQKHFDGVYATHGKDSEKEGIIEQFKDNGSILVATTLFEVGISLPNLSIIVIVGAERLGFATLHQLRGRVSRNGMEGFCYLYTNNADSARLQEFSRIFSGFEVAELDLKYRSGGDILRGIRQSGEQFKYFNIAEDKQLVQFAQQMLDD